MFAKTIRKAFGQFSFSFDDSEFGSATSSPEQASPQDDEKKTNIDNVLASRLKDAVKISSEVENMDEAKNAEKEEAMVEVVEDDLLWDTSRLEREKTGRMKVTEEKISNTYRTWNAGPKSTPYRRSRNQKNAMG